MYKILTVIYLILGISLNTKSQDCGTLDSLNSFHGLKLGETIPADLEKALNHANGYYAIDFDSLSPNNQNKFSFLFKFLERKFETILFQVSSKEEVYSIHLWSPLDFMDSIDISHNKSPDSFNMLYYKFISLFGKVSRTEEENNPVLYNSTGIIFKYIWECKDIRLTLTLSRAAEDKRLNTTEVIITDKNIEKQVALSKLRK